MKIPPPIVAVIVAFAMWQTHKLSILTDVFSHSVMQFFMIGIIIAIGFFLEVSALVTFAKHKTTVNPIKPNNTSKVITVGVYRISRNPMYLGMQLQLLGFSFYLNNWLAIVISFTYMAYITAFQIIPEELVLKQKFTTEYQQYQKNVPRWFIV